MAHFLDDLRQAFAAFPDRPALCYRGRTIAYRDLERLVERAAAWLQAAGVGVGDRVALFTDDKLPLLVAQLGVTWCGGVAVPLNPRFTREEMR
ncbi:MAG: AMP-binding protein, partial [Vicinamibacterales bacterium]